MPVSPRTRWLLRVLGVTLVAALPLRWAAGRAVDGSGEVDPALTIDPRPLSAAAYGQRLRREGGGELEPRELVARARELSADLEARLTARARRIDPGATDWRTVYARLQDDAPATDEEILAAYRAEDERAEAFCRRHDLVPLPAAPPTVFPIANPALRRLFPLAMNRGDGTLGITLEPPPTQDTSASRSPAAPYRRNHCRVCIPPIAVHESYPGHHVAFAIARAGEAGADSGRWPFFHEGWAQYAEVLMWELGYWQGDPAREMGALHLMLLRTTRAEVDAGLHGGGLTPAAAEKLYAERLLLDAEAAASEVAGHLQSPGKKASYLVGALQVLALRDALGSPRGSALRPFHERFLARPGAIPELARTSFGVEIPALPHRGLLPPGD